MGFFRQAIDATTRERERDTFHAEFWKKYDIKHAIENIQDPASSMHMTCQELLLCCVSKVSNQR